MKDIVVYHVDETTGELDSDGSFHFFPIIVEFREEGYYRTNWDYGTDFKLAKEAVNSLNAKRGFTPKQVDLVVLSSMFPNSRVTAEEVAPNR